MKKNGRKICKKRRCILAAAKAEIKRTVGRSQMLAEWFRITAWKLCPEL
jgi:hypothetical protein